MSSSLDEDNNKREFERWFSQAEFDLGAARTSLNSENYEWACFQAQQAAEKALKAFLFLNGKRVIMTPSIYKLIQECITYNAQFKEISEVKALDMYYIPTRYPNGLPDQIPHEFYNKEDAEECVGYAEKTLSLIKKLTKK
ncbi:MAG: HEPN domain-containing protein [Candidatus Helarchaeales archaeon]